MSKIFIDTIEQAIRGQYHLQRCEKKWILPLEEDADWRLEKSDNLPRGRPSHKDKVSRGNDDFSEGPDASRKRIHIHVPVEDSIAFSLDDRRLKPFTFFDDEPPQDFAKMCDAILFL